MPPESSLHHVYLVTTALDQSPIGRREVRAWRARQGSSRWYAAEARVRDHVHGILAVATVFQHGRADHVPLESSLHRVHLVPRPLQQVPIRQHIQKRLARWYGVQRRVRDSVDVPPEVAIRLKRGGVRNVPLQAPLPHVYLVTAAPDQGPIRQRIQRFARWYGVQ